MKKWLIILFSALLMLCCSCALASSMEGDVLQCDDPALEKALRAGTFGENTKPVIGDGEMKKADLQKIRYLTLTADMLDAGQTSVNLDALQYCSRLIAFTYEAGVPAENMEALSELAGLCQVLYTGGGEETVDLGFLGTCGQGTRIPLGIFEFRNCRCTNLAAIKDNKKRSNIRLTLTNPDEAELLAAMKEWPKNVKRLTLDHSDVSEGLITAIAKSKLTELGISAPTAVGDLSLLAKSSLTHLLLQDVDNLDLSVVAGWKKLNTLTLDNCQSWKTLSALDSKKMAALHFVNCQNVELPDMAAWKKLATLTFEMSSVTDYAPIAALPKLDRFEVRYPQQESPDFSWLADAKWLAKVESISLIQCGLTDADAEALAGAKKLTGLYLSNNALTSIAFMENMKGLEVVTLNNNAVRTYEPLGKLKKLGSVDLATCEAAKQFLDEKVGRLAAAEWAGDFNQSGR